MTTCITPPCGIFTTGSCDPTCECVPDLCNLPNPYAVEGETEQECHCTTVVQQLYVTGLSLKTEIAMPECDGTVVAAIAGIHSVITGSYLWNPTYGHLKITGFDYATEQVTLENECQDDNADPGTVIPACTLFLAVDEPCCDESLGGALYYPYLAADFTAPAVGNCLDITVTSSAALATGMEVQISTGVYRIAGIVSSTIINICNDGEGITAGVVVDAIDASGVYLVPIITVGVALCAGSSDTSGALVVCADGLPTVLSGSNLGYIPALVDVTTYEVEFTDPATLFSIDPCSWDLSDRVINDIVTYFSYADGGVIAPAATASLDRMTSSPVLIQNDTCAVCNVLLAFFGYNTGQFDADDGDYANISIALSVGHDIADIGDSSVLAGTVVVTVPKEIAFNRTADPIYHTTNVEWMQSYEIPAGQELQVGFSVDVTNNASNVNSYDTNEIYGEIKGMYLSI